MFSSIAFVGSSCEGKYGVEKIVKGHFFILNVDVSGEFSGFNFEFGHITESLLEKLFKIFWGINRSNGERGVKVMRG